LQQCRNRAAADATGSSEAPMIAMDRGLTTGSSEEKSMLFVSSEVFF